MTALKQSFSWDGFIRDQSTTPHELVIGAAKIGYQGVDLVDQQYWPLIKDHGMAVVSMTGHALAPDGLNRRENLPSIERDIRKNLEQAVRWNIPYLLCFSGNRINGVDDTTATQITAENLHHLAQFFVGTDVTLVMELLNSKVANRNYQADKSAWAIDVCRRVNSPHIKLLYDIYHMQIMEGDIIATIRREHTTFAHYHTAGVPGRNDLDETQELYYPAVVRAIRDTGHTGYIAHEFFPKGNPLDALREAFNLCNV